MGPSLCIGVPTHKRPKDLDSLLAALIPQLESVPNTRLVVVNDGSHNAAYQAVIDRYRDHVDYRIHEVSRGPGAARQTAYAGATEDWLVLTDDDCVPPQAWLAWIAATVSAHPEADIFAGIAVPVWTAKPGFFTRWWTRPVLFPRPVFTPHGLLTAAGANAVVRRTAYEQAVGPEPLNHVPMEDCWLTQKIVRNGSSYNVLRSGHTGHQARNSLGDLWRRFQSYGRQGAMLTRQSQDVALDEIGGGDNFSASWANIKRKTGMEWTEPYHKSGGLTLRLGWTLVAFWTAIAYERGWRIGMADPSIPQTDRPRKPPLAERFVDFRKDESAGKALGLE